MNFLIEQTQKKLSEKLPQADLQWITVPELQEIAS